MENENIYSVGQINTYIKEMFSQDILLSSVYVKGEVSNLKYHSSGHLYFSLKDETGAISCVMFRGDRGGLSFPMKDGDKVTIFGSVGVYVRGGSYQLYAKRITLTGAGLLYERFLKLKKELEEMGMFDPRYKRPIKKYNMRIGVVTSPTGAAIRDIQNISGRRNPYVQLILYPALVQGDGAAESIVTGIRMLDQASLDVIIVGRGGGSLEDLMAFNEESVARAIFDCGTPVISAVGHETDTTISDYVADQRAPTPSAAAELAVFDLREFLETEEGFHSSMQSLMNRKIKDAVRCIQKYGSSFGYLSPKRKVRDQLTRVLMTEEALTGSMTGKIKQTYELAERYRDELKTQSRKKLMIAETRLSNLAERYKGLSPLNRLKMGFSYVENERRQAVRSVSSVRKGDHLTIHVTDGSIMAEVAGICGQAGGQNE